MPTAGTHAAQSRGLRIAMSMLWGALFVVVPIVAMWAGVTGESSDGEPFPTALRVAYVGGGALVAGTSIWVLARFVRSSTTFDGEGVHLRGILRPTTIPWSEVRGIVLFEKTGFARSGTVLQRYEYRGLRLVPHQGRPRTLPGVTVTKKWEHTLAEVVDAARPYAEPHGVEMIAPSGDAPA